MKYIYYNDGKMIAVVNDVDYDEAIELLSQYENLLAMMGTENVNVVMKMEGQDEKEKR